MGLNLQGSALVTGAGGGVGRACAEQLVRDGCLQVLITDINATTLEETASLINKISPRVTVISEVGDLQDEDTVERLVTVAVDKFGRLDYALNVAGVGGESKPIIDLSLSDYEFVNGVNAKAPWLLHRAEIRQMLKQDLLAAQDGRPGSRGSIVTVASTAGLLGFPNLSPYVMSKHAVLGLVKGDATSYGSQGIRVNAVCPGVVDTQMTRIAGDVGYAQAFVETWTPMKRMASPQEIADVIVFLCSPRASYVTGASFVVDGGQTAF